MRRIRHSHNLGQPCNCWLNGRIVKSSASSCHSNISSEFRWTAQLFPCASDVWGLPLRIKTVGSLLVKKYYLIADVGLAFAKLFHFGIQDGSPLPSNRQVSSSILAADTPARYQSSLCPETRGSGHTILLKSNWRQNSTKSHCHAQNNCSHS